MRPVFIGDELTAAGYRLAGIDVVVAAPAEAAAQLAAVLSRQPPLVLIGADCAAAIPPAVLDAALAAFAPAVGVVPDAAARVGFPDLSARVRATLGIAGS